MSRTNANSGACSARALVARRIRSSMPALAVLVAGWCHLAISPSAALAAPGRPSRAPLSLTPGVTVSGNTASEKVIPHDLN